MVHLTRSMKRVITALIVLMIILGAIVVYKRKYYEGLHELPNIEISKEIEERSKKVAERMDFPVDERDYLKGTPNDYIETDRRTDTEWLHDKIKKLKYDGTDNWPETQMGWWGASSIPPVYGPSQPKIWPY